MEWGEEEERAEEEEEEGAGDESIGSHEEIGWPSSSMRSSRSLLVRLLQASLKSISESS